MRIIDNRAVAFRTRNPGKFSILPNQFVQPVPGGSEVIVPWRLDEMRVLKNLGVKDVPSPIGRNYKWPGRYRSMGHQRTTAGFTTLHRKGFIFNEPGTGKTMSILWAMDYLMTQGEVRRCLVVCPLSIMHSAWMADINSSVIHRSAIVAHHAQAARRAEMIRGNYEIVIINYDGLNLVVPDIIANGKFDMVIVDECFVAGSMVDTPGGARRIETLCTGERVLTSSGPKHIKRLVRKTTERLVDVKTADGRTIRCTPEHPFFTDVGWVTAENLTGRRLVSADELSCMRDAVFNSQESVCVEPREGYADWAHLLAILRTEEVAPVEPGSVSVQSHAPRAAWQTERGGAIGGVQAQDVRIAQSERPETNSAWGQRNGDDRSRESRADGIARLLDMELPGSVGQEAARLSHELQARLCRPEDQTGAGGGRGESRGDGTQAAGPEERNETCGTWVDSVSRVECGSATPVYNLEIEGTPNYFVEGALVHNCNAYGNSATARWKSLARIVGPDTYLWMMTGTPAAQSPLNAYGLAKLVNPAAVPAYATAWRDKVMWKLSTFKWIPKADARDTVFNALQPAIRFTKAQCLDLPPVLKTTRMVPMTPQQQKYYKLIKDEMLVVAAGVTISAVNKAALVNKLLQVSCGSTYAENKEVVEFDAAPRLNVLLEILEETERKVIIFALYRSSITRIEEFLKKNGQDVGVIHGGVSATQRGALINSFQNTSAPRIMLMQPQATAHGLTLTAADTVVFFGPLMSVEQYVQCIARVDRQGQTSDKVTVVHIQSSPIEEKMFKALEGRVTDHALLTEMYDEEMEAK